MAPRSSKVLRETDIKKRYSVPAGFLSSLPSFNGGHAVDFQAVDGSGRVWPFRCSVRKKGHPKPVISRGWRAFVDSKGLKVGDKVQFYKKKNEAGAKKHAYEIRAEKEIKIFDDRGEMHRAGRRKVRSEGRRDGERLAKQASFSPLVRRWPRHVKSASPPAESEGDALPSGSDKLVYWE
ncbi:hypothetical protein DKX38_021868 [Salix brachista]|uniref:TF-B3 domain-containing protein n=1 Tax=Salix brachista TaxID=2182728 RepID=A0A5N5JY90_9ROSI|nr:hypothetical protein DKX38_021868 [Salix brachista]